MKILKILTILLLGFILVGWWSYAPSSDKADPYYDLGRILYYLIIMPAGGIGVLVSSYFLTRLKRELNIRKWKILASLLLVVSICTVLPPLFEKTRYIFYPLSEIVYKYEQSREDKKQDQTYMSHYSYFKESSPSSHKVTSIDCGFLLLDNNIVLAPLNTDSTRMDNEQAVNAFLNKTIQFDLINYEQFKENYSTIIPIHCLKNYHQIKIDDLLVGAVPVLRESIKIVE